MLCLLYHLYMIWQVKMGDNFTFFVSIFFLKIKFQKRFSNFLHSFNVETKKKKPLINQGLFEVLQLQQGHFSTRFPPTKKIRKPLQCRYHPASVPHFRKNQKILSLPNQGHLPFYTNGQPGHNHGQITQLGQIRRTIQRQFLFYLREAAYPLCVFQGRHLSALKM